jgi:hypothetical protein
MKKAAKVIANVILYAAMLLIAHYGDRMPHPWQPAVLVLVDCTVVFFLNYRGYFRNAAHF